MLKVGCLNACMMAILCRFQESFVFFTCTAKKQSNKINKSLNPKPVNRCSKTISQPMLCNLEKLLEEGEGAELEKTLQNLLALYFFLMNIFAIVLGGKSCERLCSLCLFLWTRFYVRKGDQRVNTAGRRHPAPLSRNVDMHTVKC